MQRLPNDRDFSSMACLPPRNTKAGRQAASPWERVSQSALLASSYLKHFPCSFTLQSVGAWAGGGSPCPGHQKPEAQSAQQGGGGDTAEIGKVVLLLIEQEG